MKSVLCGSIAILLLPIAHAALPGDAAEGRRLHDANCLSCHDSGIYGRKERLVRSLDALKQQVEGCGHMAKKQFSAAESQNIVKYLNDRFYHFQ
jgi:mono/diheme cytochrome c family protein